LETEDIFRIVATKWQCDIDRALHRRFPVAEVPVGREIEKPVAGLFLHRDEVVPFSHLALHGAKLPQAIIREVGCGHQFGNDLTDVAKDIITIEEVP
jgi:hypothetical protein